MRKEKDVKETSKEAGKWVELGQKNGPYFRFHTGTGVYAFKVGNLPEVVMCLPEARRLQTGRTAEEHRYNLINHNIDLLMMPAAVEAFPEQNLGVGDFGFVVEKTQEIDYKKDHEGQDAKGDAESAAKALIALGVPVDMAIVLVKKKFEEYQKASKMGNLSLEEEAEINSKLDEYIRQLYLKGTPGEKSSTRILKVQPNAKVVSGLSDQYRVPRPKQVIAEQPKTPQVEIKLPNNW